MSGAGLAALVLAALALGLHVALCAAGLGLGAVGLGPLQGWLAVDREGRAAGADWRAWRALWRKRPAWPESGAAVTLACHGGAVVLAATAVLFAPGFLRIWPDRAGGDLLLVMGLLAAARLLAWLPALEPGIAADAQRAERALAALLREWVPIAVLGFAVAQIAGGTQPQMLPGLTRHGPAVPAALPLALACALLAMVLVAASEFAAGVPDRQVSGPDLALVQAGVALRRFGWLMLVTLLLPPAPAALDGWAQALAWPAAALIWLAKLLVAAFAAVLVGSWAPSAGRRQGAALLFAALGAVLLFASGRLA